MKSKNGSTRRNKEYIKMVECCEYVTKLIYSCSGASNVGEIADRVARKLRAEGLGRMTCLASIGAHSADEYTQEDRRKCEIRLHKRLAWAGIQYPVKY
jgi:uncharacterized metal-binding protein